MPAQVVTEQELEKVRDNLNARIDDVIHSVSRVNGTHSSQIEGINKAIDNQIMIVGRHEEIITTVLLREVLSRLAAMEARLNPPKSTSEDAQVSAVQSEYRLMRESIMSSPLRHEVDKALAEIERHRRHGQKIMSSLIVAEHYPTSNQNIIETIRAILSE